MCKENVIFQLGYVLYLCNISMHAPPELSADSSLEIFS